MFDPTKMGDIFYWYHNSLSFKNEQNFYQSRIGGKNPGDEADILGWITKINSKDSVLLTLEKAGYPYIPSGNYECSFTFSGLNRINKSTRELSDGLIWAGKITSKYSIFVN